MRIEVNMTREEDKLYINAWWAGDPAFALETLRSHLEAAQVLWPKELKGLVIDKISYPITVTENESE